MQFIGMIDYVVCIPVADIVVFFDVTIGAGDA